MKSKGTKHGNPAHQRLTRRFPIKPGQPHRDRKNDYRRRDKHPSTSSPRGETS